MAIDARSVETGLMDDARVCKRELERIARATVTGPSCAAEAIVEAAIELLDCDGAIILRPTGRPEVLAATHASARGSKTTRASWRMGPQALRLLDRVCDGAERSDQPWSRLRAKLWDLGLHSWTGVPLRREGSPHPLGLLAIGSRDTGPPARRIEHLPDLALSATTALTAAPDFSDSHCAMDARTDVDPRTVAALTFGVSHTLGNIFGAIMGNLHFLQQELDSDTSRELLAQIESSTNRGARLMRSLQNLATVPEASAISRIDLSAAARKVAALAEGLCGHWPGCRRVRIDVDALEAAPAWCDAPRLHEALVNIIFNALQAVGCDGSVCVRTACDDAGSEVRVIDDGRGMSREVARQATEPFFSTHPEVQQGLGLTVARGTAVTHGGSLTVHRRPMRGMEVAFQLPKGPPVKRRRETHIDAGLPTVAGNRKEQMR